MWDGGNQFRSLSTIFAEGHLMLGDALVQQRLPEEAIAPLRKAVEIDPGLVQAHNKLMGKALAMMNRTEDAVRYLELASDEDPDGEIHYQLFTLYRKLGKPERANEALLAFKRISDKHKLDQDSKRQSLRDGNSAGNP